MSVLDAEGQELQVNDVVQIDPQYDRRFGACFMVISELKPTWDGLQGYVRVPGEDAGDAYYRIESNKVIRIGHAAWSHGEV